QAADRLWSRDGGRRRRWGGWWTRFTDRAAAHPAGYGPTHPAPEDAMTQKLLFENIDEPGLRTLDVYRRRGGYEMVRKALAMTRDELVHELEISGLRGRGGAGFSMGKKASFLPKTTMDKYLVCNADESEPGTFKDRALTTKNPHGLIEGVVIGAHAAGATRAFIYIRGEYQEVADI